VGGRIQFSGGAYDHLISLLGDLGLGLRDAGSGSVPLSAEVQVQPSPQTWAPAQDLVAAAQQYFGGLGQWNTATAEVVGDLRDAVTDAKAVLLDIDEQATDAARRMT
jgi:hypothetical protein